MTNFLLFLHRLVWGAPVLILILGVGLYLSIITRFVQLRLLPRAVRTLISRIKTVPNESTGVSPFQALCTALAATVGTGNLVGVAGAICLGGPGAIFWMWICAILGMVTKFAEATLAIHYRTENMGGPMYTIRHGLGKRWRFLAVLYAVFGVIASFGVGNATQINAVVTGINSALRQVGIQESPARNLGFGLILAVSIGTALLGGAGRIGRTAEILIPFISGAYILLCIGVLLLRFDSLGRAFALILKGAFSPEAVTGGIIGSSFQVLRTGCSRGVFTNEAGMGTASIAHAGAAVNHPCEQGMLGILEVFLDTIVICTLTALVILVSGAPIPYGRDAGATLSADSFSHVYGGWVKFFLAGALCCFAVATVLGWGLYGARCSEFLFGKKAWKYFTVGQVGAVILASVSKTESLWLLAEIMNGLMAIPNLITLFLLSPVLRCLTNEYERNSGR